MITFLTSSPTIPSQPVFNPQNSFIDRLQAYWKKPARCLLIAADPSDHCGNDAMTDYYRQTIENSGLPIIGLDLWDNRYYDFTEERVAAYDVIILSCGHVPTQKNWFESVNVKGKMIGFNGVLIGISAGSMISAKTVYAWPEMDGETLDSDYPLFFEGLGFAQTMILPHYQSVKDRWLDGKRLVEDIAFGDSRGRRFLAIPDGSYVMVENGTEIVCGEAYQVSDGVLTPFCQENEQRIAFPVTSAA